MTSNRRIKREKNTIKRKFDKKGEKEKYCFITTPLALSNGSM